MLVTCLIAAWTAIVCEIATAQTPVVDANADAARTTVRNALAFLGSDTFAWREQRKCAACHHGPMFVWAANVAGARGYAVSKSDVSEITRWLTVDDSARVFPRTTAASDERPTLSLATVFIEHALNAASAGDELAAAGRAKTTDHLVASQRRDGSWPSPAGRPPFFGSDANATRLARLAILESPKLTKSPQLRQAADRAKSWLTRQPTDDDQQAITFNLWEASLSGDAASDRLVAQLRKAQQPDGGWRQTNELPSDAFATGQALFALSRAKLNSSDEAILRAIAFLVRTQQADGTWPMRSQIDSTTGRAARNLNPLTYAAAAWAVLGVASHVGEHAADNAARPTETIDPSPPSSVTEKSASGESPKANRAAPVPECRVGGYPGGRK
jgi:hypothetical protein